MTRSRATPDFPSVARVVQYATLTSQSDKMIKTMGYTCGLLSQLVRHLPRNSQNPHPSTMANIFQSCASQMSAARYIPRLYGILQVLDAHRHQSWDYPDDSKAIQDITQWQVYTMMLYYPLENLAWLGFTASKWLHMDASKYSRHSCVMWSSYLLLDLWATLKRIQMIKQKKEHASKSDQQKLAQRITELKWQLVRDLLYLAQGLHWSLKTPLLPEFLVQLFGFSEAVIDIWRSIRVTTPQK